MSELEPVIKLLGDHWQIAALVPVIFAFINIRKLYWETRKTKAEAKIKEAEFAKLEEAELDALKSDAPEPDLPPYPEYEPSSTADLIQFWIGLLVTGAAFLFVAATQPPTTMTLAAMAFDLVCLILVLAVPLVTLLLKNSRHSMQVHSWTAMRSLLNSAKLARAQGDFIRGVVTELGNVIKNMKEIVVDVAQNRSLPESHDKKESQ
jgi:hypothetical protein